MGLIKTVQVQGKEIQVRTITLGDMLRLGGRPITLYEMMFATLRPQDQAILDEIEYTLELSEEIDKMLKAFIEVNPALTQEKAKDFLQKKTTETSGNSNTGSSENSTTPPAKQTK